MSNRFKNYQCSKVPNSQTNKNNHDLRHQIGLLSYYKRYIKNIAKIAYPLFQLWNKDQANAKILRPTTTVPCNE